VHSPLNHCRIYGQRRLYGYGQACLLRLATFNGVRETDEHPDVYDGHGSQLVVFLVSLFEYRGAGVGIPGVVHVCRVYDLGIPGVDAGR